MFAPSYFPARYFPGRYFPPVVGGGGPVTQFIVADARFDDLPDTFYLGHSFTFNIAQVVRLDDLPDGFYTGHRLIGPLGPSDIVQIARFNNQTLFRDAHRLFRPLYTGSSGTTPTGILRTPTTGQSTGGPLRPQTAGTSQSDVLCLTTTGTAPPGTLREESSGAGDGGDGDLRETTKGRNS